MVDKINPLGQAQNLPQFSKVQKPLSEGEVEKAAAIDEVILSEEAINLTQIEDMARHAGSQLAKDEQAALSSNEQRLNALI